MDNTLAQNPNDLFSIQSRPSRVWDQVRHFNRKLEPTLRAKKFSLMAQSPSAFFRGTNHLYWADWGKSDLLKVFGGGKDTRLWINADLYNGHFGSFTDATGRLVYDLNDFHESVVADYQHDLWRLGVSLVMTGRENLHPPAVTRKMVIACALGYWRELKRCRWYPNVRHAPWDEEQASGSLRHFLTHARKHLGIRAMLESWTKPGKDGFRLKIQGNPDLQVLSRETAKKLEKSLDHYAADLRPWPGVKPRLFKIMDMARLLNNGAGLEGLKRYYALVRVHETAEDACRILELQQQGEPSAWKYLPLKARKKTTDLCGGSQSLRVDLACRALGRYPDPWLGRLEFQGDEFLVQERSPYAGVLPSAMMDEGAAYQLGAILARAHCRAKKSFARKAFNIIREDRKAFRKQVSALSHAYADQVELDYKGFLKMEKKK